MSARIFRLRSSFLLLASLHLSGCGSAPPVAPAPVPPADTAPLPPATFSRELNSTSIFIGASIINYWALPIHNAGIAGQNSSQVLARFKTEVLNHGYARVIILVGTNDIIQNNKDLPGELTTNLQSMALMARDAGLNVYLSELPPVTSNGVDLNATVATVNAAIKQLAAQQSFPVIDFFSPLYGHPEYFPDGIHPNAAGYSVMERALAAVVTH